MSASRNPSEKSEIDALRQEVQRLREERDAVRTELTSTQTTFEETLRLRLEVYTQELEKRVTEKAGKDFRAWMTGIIAVLAAAGFGAWETVQHSIEKATEEKVAAAVKEQVKISSDKLEEEAKTEQDALRRLREQTMDATASFKVEAKQALSQIESSQHEVEAKRDVVIKSLELVNGEVTQLTQQRVTTSISSSNRPETFTSVSNDCFVISSTTGKQASVADDNGGVFSTSFLETLRELSASGEEVKLQQAFWRVSERVWTHTKGDMSPSLEAPTGLIDAPARLQPVLLPMQGNNSQGQHGIFRAVLVGIKNYHEPFGPLSSTEQDILNLAAFLQTKSYEVKELLDATRAQVMDAIEWAKGQSHPEDTILFYFSGHTISLPGNQPKYLVFLDSTKDPKTYIAEDEIVRFISELKAASRFVFIDG